MQPSLDDAYLRIKRAREHIQAIRKFERRIAIKPDEIVTKHNVEMIPSRGFAVLADFPDFIIPPAPLDDHRWAIRFGETIYNLRAALDYLVYSLAYLGSGKECKSTQFPICSDPCDFKQAIKRGHLRGVNAAHRAAIETLQPYPGRHASKWLTDLSRFSNPDKHRRLTVVTTRVNEQRRYPLTPAVVMHGVPMQVEFTATRYITLGDAAQTPVIPTLDSLVAHVTDTLNQFKPDF